MMSCWCRLREHGVPIWRSNQIWLYNNDDCKIMALNPLENSPGLLNCLSGKSKIGTDSGVSLSNLIKHYRQLNVIYFLEHWLNFAPKTVIRFAWMWGVGGLTESLGSFPHSYTQLALELSLLSLSHLTAKAGIKLLGDYLLFSTLDMNAGDAQMRHMAHRMHTQWGYYANVACPFPMVLFSFTQNAMRKKANCSVERHKGSLCCLLRFG